MSYGKREFATPTSVNVNKLHSIEHLMHGKKVTDVKRDSHSSSAYKNI